MNLLGKGGLKFGSDAVAWFHHAKALGLNVLLVLRLTSSNILWPFGNFAISKNLGLWADFPKFFILCSDPIRLGQLGQVRQETN